MQIKNIFPQILAEKADLRHASSLSLRIAKVDMRLRQLLFGVRAENSNLAKRRM